MIEIDILIFDVDGTLVDSTTDIVKSVNFTLRALGLQEKPFKQTASYIGKGTRDLIKRSLGINDVNLINKGLEIYRDYYLEHSTDESRLYPHVKEILSYFSLKKKFILTNRYKESAQVTLNRLGIGIFFEEIIGGDNEDCLKPAPCSIEKLASRLKVDRKKILFIGDMDLDVVTGKNADVKTCWVTYGLGKREDVEKLRPDFIIDDLTELKDMIN
ncbi:MAG: HAD-IA family hydrolase [bacterium]